MFDRGDKDYRERKAGRRGTRIAKEERLTEETKHCQKNYIWQNEQASRVEEQIHLEEVRVTNPQRLSREAEEAHHIIKKEIFSEKG